MIFLKYPSNPKQSFAPQQTGNKDSSHIIEFYDPGRTSLPVNFMSYTTNILYFHCNEYVKYHWQIVKQINEQSTGIQISLLIQITHSLKYLAHLNTLLIQIPRSLM